ncbi:MAG TPA: ribbon-helix-helix protein, CopG family [Methanoregulaceae archaeon]|jgi:predicted DNA-binding protein|nr:ribbon-helix-helix protein, CopG family [Burkholderiaceae bacterium]NLH25271.1 ribbon-helix-helix protein, CopG family [Methanomicrobiales archaeon]HMZ32050.1 ribbon-helix-helix protein, CopG family [Methanoregulaceae archaeon]HNB02897.1 ribbon-helix-helix protein, CopG family [Methanoregulaceae archaeon]HNI42351.1 ribbon-helix-helix protein, CopG family [Methanoregulaceae archaeon]
MTRVITIRIPDDRDAALEQHAQEVDRNKSYIIRKAAELSLQEYADYLIALERLRDKDDLIISADEMRKRLGISH